MPGPHLLPKLFVVFAKLGPVLKKDAICLPAINKWEAYILWEELTIGLSVYYIDYVHIIYIHIYIWVNYNDLTATSLES